MRRFLIPGVVVLVAVAALALLTYGVANHTDTGSIDAKVAKGRFPLAPGYRDQLPVLGSDRTADLASFHHRIVVMNVYASWCIDCRAESKLLASEQKTLAAHGATLVGITYEDNSSASLQFDRQYGLRYPVLRDVNGDLVRAFGTYQVPESFVIGRDGRIEALERGPVDRQWFSQVVMPLVDRAHA